MDLLSLKILLRSTQKLDLRKMDLRESIEGRLLESFDFPSEMMLNASAKFDGCLAALIDFYEVHDKLSDFIQWIANQEVAAADSRYVIFKDKHSTAYKLGLYFLNQNNGRLRFKQAIEPSVKKIRSLTEDLGTVDHNEELSIKFVQDLLGIVSEILSSLKVFFGTFPVAIRELFATIEKKAQEKLKFSGLIAGAVLFRRFLCPWMLDADLNGTPYNPATLRLLGVVCKIILSLFSSDKVLDEASEALRIHICKFINENSAVMADLSAHFTDTEDIIRSRANSATTVYEIKTNSSIVDSLVEIFQHEEASIERTDSDLSETSEPASTCTTGHFPSYEDEYSDSSDSSSFKACETESFSVAIPMQNFNSHRTNTTSSSTSKGETKNDRVLSETIYEREVLTVSGEKVSFGSIVKNQKVLLMLLRQAGCIFCRRSASEFSQVQHLLAQRGIKLVAIVPGSINAALKFKTKFNFAGDIFIDSERRIYDDLKCKHGLKEVLNKNTLKAIASTWKKGYRQGKTNGSVTQLGGLFIIREDGTYMRHIEQFAGDFVDLPSVLYECGIDDETIENLRLKTPKEIRLERKKAKKISNKLRKSLNRSIDSDTETDDF